MPAQRRTGSDWREIIADHGEERRFADLFLAETTTLGVRAAAYSRFEVERAVAAFVAQRRAEQDAADRQDAELLRGVRVEKPAVRFVSAPLKPLEIPRTDQSLLLGRSLYMAPGDGWGDVTPAYEPVEDGGFQITGGKRSMNRVVVHGPSVMLARVSLASAEALSLSTTGAELPLFAAGRFINIVHTSLTYWISVI